MAYPGEDFKDENMENTERTTEEPVLCVISMGLMSQVEVPVGTLVELEARRSYSRPKSFWNPSWTICKPTGTAKFIFIMQSPLINQLAVGDIDDRVIHCPSQFCWGFHKDM